MSNVIYVSSSILAITKIDTKTRNEGAAAFTNIYIRAYERRKRPAVEQLGIEQSQPTATDMYVQAGTGHFKGKEINRSSQKDILVLQKLLRVSIPKRSPSAVTQQAANPSSSHQYIKHSVGGSVGPVHLATIAVCSALTLFQSCFRIGITYSLPHDGTKPCIVNASQTINHRPEEPKSSWPDHVCQLGPMTASTLSSEQPTTYPDNLCKRPAGYTNKHS